MSEFSSNFLKEKEVVKNYQLVFENCGFSNLKKVFTHQNLATLRFKEIWPLELYSSQTYSAYNMLARLYSACQEKPNPLLKESEVIKRREMLRVILKIPF